MKAFGGRGTLHVADFSLVDVGELDFALCIGPVGIIVTEFALPFATSTNSFWVASLIQVNNLRARRTGVQRCHTEDASLGSGCHPYPAS